MKKSLLAISIALVMGVALSCSPQLLSNREISQRLISAFDSNESALQRYAQARAKQQDIHSGIMLLAMAGVLNESHIPVLQEHVDPMEYVLAKAFTALIEGDMDTFRVLMDRFDVMAKTTIEFLQKQIELYEQAEMKKNGI